MNMLPSTVTDDPTTYIKTVKELIKEIYSLEDEHRKYLRDLERKTKYGSKYVFRYWTLSFMQKKCS